MTSSSRSSTLASLRCLAVLPVCGGNPPGSSDSMTRGLNPEHGARSGGRVQATHYTRYLEQKVSSAIFSLSRRMQQWGGAAPGEECPVRLPGVVHSPERGQPSSHTPPVQSPSARPPPPPTATDGSGTSLAVAVRKRSASEASLEEPAHVRQACPLSSSLLQHGSHASDDGGSPSGPVGPASQAEYGWDGAAESARVPRQSSGDVGLLAARGGGLHGLPAQPSALLPKPTLQPKLSTAHSQPQQPNKMAARLPTVAGAATGAPQTAARPRVLHDGWLDRPHSFAGGRGPPPAALPADAGISAGGSMMLPPPARTSTTQTQLYHEQHIRRVPAAARHAVSAAVSVDVQQASPAHREGSPRCAPPHICELPAPSRTLHQLIVRKGLGAGDTSGCEQVQAATGHASCQHPLQLQPPLTQQPPPRHELQVCPWSAEETLAHEGAGISAILGCGNPQLRAALEATAAATIAHWQQQIATLPPMDMLYQRWSLGSLRQQLGSAAGGRHPGTRSSCGGGGVAGCRGPGETDVPVLRHVQTPLPRRLAAVRLDRTASSSGPGTALPLQALVAPLPADTCQGRNDLWDLFLLNLPMAMDRKSEPGAAEGGAGCCCCGGADGGGGVDGSVGSGPSGGGRAAEEHCGQVDEQGGQEDSDVYISSEGLACLASLASLRPGRGGWRLPFLVRQWLPSEESDKGPGDDRSPAPVADRCCRCGGVRPCSAKGSAAALGPDRPPTLYFAEPLSDPPALLLDSWSRMCANALASSCSAALSAGRMPGRCCGAAAAAAPGGFGAGVPPCGAAESEGDCPCCQQDEWELGGLSLLVLSHCGARFGGGGGSPPVPVQLVALAGAVGPASDAARREASQVAAAALALRCPELAYRAELLGSDATTMVVVVAPEDGSLLAQHCLDRGALRQLAAERRAQQPQGTCWELVHALLMELRRLRPGPYILCLEPSAHSLELRGVEGWGERAQATALGS